MPLKTIKISAGYSDKVSENYNSKSYSISLETEISLNGNATQDITDASGRLFSLCKSIVNSQRGVSVDNLLAPEAPAQSQNQPSSNGNNGKPKAATTKQINYLLSLARKSGLSDDEIKGIPAMYYHKQTFDSLTSVEATKLIDNYKAKKYKKAA